MALSPSQVKADQESQGSGSMFTSLVAAIEASQAELLEVVERGRRAAELQAHKLIHDLEGEMDELRRRTSALAQLSQATDHVFFLKVRSCQMAILEFVCRLTLFVEWIRSWL